jgi:CRISPR-associated endonuclease/helicase Cas3
MSATGDEDGTKRFSLEECDLDGNSDTNPILRRFEAPKSLTLHEGLSDTDSKIVEQAASLAKDGSRVVVFVHSPDTAIKIAKSLCNRGAKGKKEFADSVEILTGTMRGLERDELLAKPIMKRFLYPENSYEQGPAILVSTSAGEVGFDLNADHLVCDVAPLDSIIQRLGRVNRRGDGKAEVHLFAKKIDGKKKPKEEEDPPKHTFESASIAALEVLKTLPKVSEEETAVIYDASPRAFAQIDKPLIALSPKPYAVELTDILLDAWSMTTVTERMPGRPPVGPWLRGVDEEGPQTTIAWRTELDLDGFGELDTNDIEEWFDAHRILPHETLTVPTRSAADWLLKRYKTLSSERRSEIDQRACIIDRVGIKVLEFGKLIGELNIKRLDSILDADVILPASFGGIERGEGLLDESAPEPVKGDPGSVPDFLKEPDVADVTVKYPRFRQWRTVGDDADPEETALKVLVGEEPSNSEKFSRFAVELPSDKNGHVQLISFVPKSERREFGTQKQSLVCHVGLVEKYASEIANRLTLPPDILRALELAAAWHDRGKDRDIWQRAVGGEPGKDAIGKSGGSMRPISRNYRHEFGSIRELSGAHEGKIDANIFDLAMHMIAAHHGRGRPHFPKGGFDPCARASSPQIATDAIRRFARLQRHYGHWRLAWLENLLRCADAMASAEKEG